MEVLNDMNTALAHRRPIPRLRRSSITSPADGAMCLRQPDDHGRRERRRRRGRRAVLRRRGRAGTRGHGRALRGPVGHATDRPTARTRLTARARDGGRQVDAVVGRQRDRRQRRLLPEPGARDRLRPADEHRVPAGRAHARRASWPERSRSCRRRTRRQTRRRSCSSRTSVAPGCSRACSTSCSTRTSRRTTTTTSSTRSGCRTWIACPGSPPTRASPERLPDSELVLYQDPQVADAEHHGGALNFGNDGMLYFTTGDHFQGTPSQDLNSPRGKVHRIFPDGLVPTDNPFYDGNGPHWDSVWALRAAEPVSGVLRPADRQALHRRGRAATPSRRRRRS